MKPLSWIALAVSSLALALLAGCGQQTAPVDATATNESTPSSSPPTASIPAQAPTDEQREPLPEAGTPEWLVLEMTRLRVAKLPTEQPGPDGVIQPVSEEEAARRIRSATRDRNRQIVELAKEAIAKTFDDPAKERVYTAAVHHLTEARLQLALLDEDPEDVKALYNDARVLYERDPESKAAAEAAFGLVRFAETNARQRAGQETKWLKEFARQAQLFAVNFPRDARAVAKLDAAGWSCEVHGMTDDALACYTLIRDEFPETPQAQYVAGVLRRLGLQGQPLMLAGPTFDGGFASIDQFRGKVVLVAFWSAANPQFQQDLQTLTSLAERHKAAGFMVLGVNVDEEEALVQSFLETHGLLWPTIFHVDPARRGWNGDAVRYYGVRNVPTYWLVDRGGVVAETLLTAPQIEARVAALLAEPAGEPE